jgi:hypothetical protein
MARQRPRDVSVRVLQHREVLRAHDRAAAVRDGGRDEHPAGAARERGHAEELRGGALVPGERRERALQRAQARVLGPGRHGMVLEAREARPRVQVPRGERQRARARGQRQRARGPAGLGAAAPGEPREPQREEERVLDADQAGEPVEEPPQGETPAAGRQVGSA